MKIYELAWQNVKGNLRSYLSLILSLAFTVMILFNFQSMIYSDTLAAIGRHNQEYSKMIIQTLSIVLGVFMVFFIGYASNVFLTRRKKEIGIYVFMGLTNQKIGSLYLLEMTMVGIITIVLGIGVGALTTQLFQMMLLAMSDITVEIGFQFANQPVLLTIAFFFGIYMFFVCKGYINIVRSSVLNLVSASRQNEYVQQSRALLMIKTVLGVGVLSFGYYMAIKDGGTEVLENVAKAVVCVIIGVYLIFGGLIPVIFQGMARNKIFLYHRERTLWVNQLIFRMKKNYRTYAMVCVLMTCSVTALAISFAINERYENMIQFRNTYTYQLLSNQTDLGGAAEKIISQENTIAYQTKIPILTLEDSLMILNWQQVKQAAKDAGLVFEVENPKDGELIELTHLYLMSFMTKREDIPITVLDREFQQILEINEPYLGYLQENITFYIVNDTEYKKLLPYGEELYTYNYKIQDVYNYEASQEALGTLVSNTEENYTARIVTGPESNDLEWVKILYSLGVFMVMVFIAASGSILFMKIYNDAFEEQGRYRVLQKLGYSYRTLKRAVAKELFAAYALPFVVMAISSYFSVHALEKVMNTGLFGIRMVSVGVIFVFFLFCYWRSVRVYVKNAGIRHQK